ncbi:MAG: hypothetical protein WC661_14550 [Opitutaceae bacterium]
MHYLASQRRPACAGFLFCALITVFLASPSLGTTIRASQRADDLARLRRIAMASLIYTSNHNDQFPDASDVWDYARILAETSDLDDAHVWQARIDPAANPDNDKPITVLSKPRTGSPRQLNPAFLQIKPSVAVVLGKLTATMPPTTPIAWTRGLQIDGTWANHSPYGSDGGCIVFLGGNVMFYHNLTAEGSQLTRFDGKGKTTNILEALPPGTRIGEYEPTAEEKIAWGNGIRREIHLRRSIWYSFPNLIPLSLIWTPFILLALYRLKGKKKLSAAMFIWPVLLTILLLNLFPVVG